MDATVLYFNRGTSCDIRLLVSIFSLRKHYHGAITLLQEGELRFGVRPVLEEFGVRIKYIACGDKRVLVRKASLWREMDSDHALYLDSDTVVCSPVDELIELTRRHELVVTWFNRWPTAGRPIRRRIEEWRSVAPGMIASALAYGKAINTGVQGWSRTARALPEYEELTKRGANAGCNPLFLDEIAMQLLLPRHQHHLADPEWNTSGEYGDTSVAKIIHYHGRKHCRLGQERCYLWKQHYFELLRAFPDFSAILQDAGGDRRLFHYIRDIDRPRKDITVVTAVDPKYSDKLRRNLIRWLALPGLRQQRFLVFVNGFKGPHERTFLNHPNVRVVRWSYPFREASRREFMLAAFVLGTAKFVRTSYWMKLDADCEPQRPWWEFPDFQGQTIVSHRWGFTRMKQDLASRHWFNRLDDVFSPDAPLFQRIFSPSEGRIVHGPDSPDRLARRFNSFCHIEKTDFTRRIVAHLEAKCSGRMAIPSQDTMAWYCATLWEEKVKLENMKRWFTQ